MANENPDIFDPYQSLEEYASRIDGIRESDLSLKPFYDWMSGALVWRDETRPDTPTRLIWALRPVWAYRTSLMLGEPREELAQCWQFGLERFPNWVGFLPERREPRAELLEIYRKGKVKMLEALRETG